MSPRPRSPMPDRLVRAPGALWRAGAFGVVVLPPGARTPVTLAGTGARLWAGLDAPRTVSELAAALAAEYHADPAVVAGDLQAPLDELLALAAVERVA